jgi:hypothetical protein
MKSDVSTAPQKPRQLVWRFEQVFKSATALKNHGHPVNSTTIRALLNELHLLTQDGGNQWIGDLLGEHGLHLPKYQKGGKTNYTVPDDGITPELIIEYFLVPLGYPWDMEVGVEKFEAAAATLPRDVAATPRKPAQPAKPARIASRPDTAAFDALAEARQVVRSLSELLHLLHSAHSELQRVVQLLRDAPPDHTAAEAGLHLAEQLLAAADRVSDEEVPPVAEVQTGESDHGNHRGTGGGQDGLRPGPPPA